MTNEEILNQLPPQYIAVMSMTFIMRKGSCSECYFGPEACNKIQQQEEFIPCPEGYCWRIMKNGIDITERNE